MTGDVDEIRTRLADVRARIARAGGEGVSILAVTKGFDADLIPVAHAAGCTAIGENYTQELLGKRDAIEAAGDLEVHFIGQLQTNKVRQLAGLITVYESVDRERLVHEIAKRDPGAQVLLQVDTSAVGGEVLSGKGGCPVDALDPLVKATRASGLHLRGLMTVGPTAGGPEAARAGFEIVRAAVDRLGLEVCSMGMTDDLEVAVECGTTQVRVGTALFGSRPVPARRDQER